MELAVTAIVPESGTFGLQIRRSPDGAEQTRITVDTRDSTLSVDTTRASLSPHICQRYPICGDEQPQDIRVQTAPFGLCPGEALHLRVFLDKSILEVYANRRQCVTQRMYPTRKDSLGTAVFGTGGVTRVSAIDAWDIAATNTGRRP